MKKPTDIGTIVVDPYIPYRDRPFGDLDIILGKRYSWFDNWLGDLTLRECGVNPFFDRERRESGEAASDCLRLLRKADYVIAPVFIQEPQVDKPLGFYSDDYTTDMSPFQRGIVFVSRKTLESKGLSHLAAYEVHRALVREVEAYSRDLAAVSEPTMLCFWALKEQDIPEEITKTSLDALPAYRWHYISGGNYKGPYKYRVGNPEYDLHTGEEFANAVRRFVGKCVLID